MKSGLHTMGLGLQTAGLVFLVTVFIVALSVSVFVFALVALSLFTGP